MAERNQLAKSELVAELITFYHINMLSTFQDNFGEAVIPLTYSCAPKRTMTYSSLAPLLRRQRSSGAKGPQFLSQPSQICRMPDGSFHLRGKGSHVHKLRPQKIKNKPYTSNRSTPVHLYIFIISALLCHGIKSPTNGTGTQVIAGYCRPVVRLCLVRLCDLNVVCPTDVENMGDHVANYISARSFRPSTFDPQTPFVDQQEWRRASVRRASGDDRGLFTMSFDVGTGSANVTFDVIAITPDMHQRFRYGRILLFFYQDGQWSDDLVTSILEQMWLQYVSR